MTESSNNDLGNKIKQAEDAVKNMADQKLKEEAFKIILTSLISGGSHHHAAPEIHKPKDSRVKRNTLNKSSRVPKVTVQSTLKFGTDELKQLKEYFESFSKLGEELTVFVLANFLTEKAGKQTFNEADIKYSYDALLSVRPSNTPPPMRQDKISRAIRWVATASRKKMWLESVAGGAYKISPQGIIFISSGLKDYEKTAKSQ